MDKQDITKDSSFEIVRLGLRQLESRYGLSPTEIIGLVDPILAIPLASFSTDLGALETIVKYLHEEKRMRFCEIAALLSRDERTIWATYAAAKKKRKSPLPTGGQGVPVSIFADRERSVFACLVDHLVSTGMSKGQIASALKRRYATIWAAYRRPKHA